MILTFLYFQPTMNETIEKAVGKITLDFSYFIQLAIRRELSWKSLAFMMTDMTTTLDISKRVILVLVQELEKLASKLENEPVHKKLTRTFYTNEKQVNVQNEDVKTNLGENEENVEYFDYLDSDNESITGEESHEAQEELKESRLKVQTESSISEENILFDFPADKFYEFIGNNEKPSQISSDDEEVELPNEETTSNCEIEEKQKDHKKDKSAIDGEKGKKNLCSYCGKCFLKKAWKERHERIHTGEKPFECKFCQKRFIEKGKLNTHERIHTGEKPYQCQICMVSFRDSETLRRHERIHIVENPYQCENCEDIFYTSSDLTRHKQIHTDETPFVCNVCSKRFTKEILLKQHEKIHCNSKPFQCKTCLKGFLKPYLLKYHENIHKDEKPYKCKTCEKCFYSPHILQRHEKKSIDFFDHFNFFTLQIEDDF